jgi:hypothetical protein
MYDATEVSGPSIKQSLLVVSSSMSSLFVLDVDGF